MATKDDDAVAAGVDFIMNGPDTPNEPFHKHLDVCSQCRDRPFDLCSEGATLLQSTADEITKWFPAIGKVKL